MQVYEEDAQGALEAIARSCDGGARSRRMSLRVLLGMLFSERPEIHELHVSNPRVEESLMNLNWSATEYWKYIIQE